MKFVNLKNDMAFIKVFTNKDKPHLLISFLNAILGLTGDKEIRTVKLLNPYRTLKLTRLKSTTLDIKATDNRNISYVIQIEFGYVAGMKKRYTDYTSQAYNSQLKRELGYPKHNQIIFLGLLDFVLFEHTDDYLSRYHVFGRDVHEDNYDEIELSFIELPKFNKASNEVHNLMEKWLYFIKNTKDLEKIPAHVVEFVLTEAYRSAALCAWTKEDLEAYEYRGIRIQDERGAFEFAYQQGLAQDRTKKAEG